MAINNVLPNADVVQIPLSDGGEGLVDCIRKMVPVKIVNLKAHGPLMEWVDAKYAISEDGHKAYMEMAATSGLTLVPQTKRNPLVTTTYGVGEMLADAIRRGCKEIVMGIGGSATCDGGKGMIRALMDAQLITENFIPQDYFPKITVACDVDNPLYGDNGAAYVFGPQKGATPEQVAELDKRLRQFAKETADKGIAVPRLVDYPGAGAAGGLGYGLMAYLGAELKSGIDIILSITRFDEHIKDADVVITGEGKSDDQTLMGKVPYGVLKRCKTHSVKVWLLSGAIDDEAGRLEESFDIAESINQADSRPLDVLMQPDVAKENLMKTVKRIITSEK